MSGLIVVVTSAPKPPNVTSTTNKKRGFLRPGGFSFGHFRSIRAECPKRDEKFKVWTINAEIVKLTWEEAKQGSFEPVFPITADHFEFSNLRGAVSRELFPTVREAKRRGNIGRADEFNVVLVRRDAKLSWRRD